MQEIYSSDLLNIFITTAVPHPSLESRALHQFDDLFGASDLFGGLLRVVEYAELRPERALHEGGELKGHLREP
jgi:hypothetical protein